MPNYFENIQGQDFVCKTLMQQLNFDKFSHAYLFIGAHGSGRLNCAKAFAKTLLGQNFESQIETDVHPDVKIYNPQGASSYLVEQIKEIVSDSILAPMQAKYKVYIICEAEKLNSASANAFLKTLEEPSDNTCFILLANNLDNVLPTIVSRCQVLKFNAIPYKDSIDYVVKESGAAHDDAKLALDLYGGNAAKAIVFCLDQNMIDFHSEIIYTLDEIDNLSDWELLQKSNDIVVKINEIIDVYKANLEAKTDDLAEVLEPSAISLLKKQNSRNITSKQKELLLLFCSCIKLYLRDKIQHIQNTEDLVYTLNVLDEIEQDLSYNINMQNFCDVVLLNVKHKGIKTYDENCTS